MPSTGTARALSDNVSYQLFVVQLETTDVSDSSGVSACRVVSLLVVGWKCVMAALPAIISFLFMLWDVWQVPCLSSPAPPPPKPPAPRRGGGRSCCTMRLVLCMPGAVCLIASVFL